SAPDVVVVDEAHGAVGGPRQENQMRYELVRALAEDPHRHLVLLTATPHSGIPQAFSRLLGLLDPVFATWNLESLTEEERARLARHFVQRTRRDVTEAWGGAPLFPERITREVTYTLSPEYQGLYDKAYAYARRLVRAGEGLGETQRRFRWWAALALLRAVMSSPRAAKAALERRGVELAAPKEGPAGEEVEAAELEAFAPQVYEAGQLLPDDEVPLPLLALAEREVRREPLRELSRLVRALTPERDTKLQGLILEVRRLLAEGHEPVVWCHYVDTAEYVAEELRRALPGVQVAAVTGRMDGELRREAIAELMTHTPRVLVATDCVSEGINLQAGFSAVVHYDLPWNPNRLEQREGRVDRYGQPKPQVVAVRYHGRDNPMDHAVLEVLLRKAERIRKDLGVHVPVPQEETYVVDRMVRHLFYQGPQPLLLSEAEEVERAWELDVERERRTRTRFAQRALKPQEAMKALEDTDQVLGDPGRVERFVVDALAEAGLTPVGEGEGVYRLPLAHWLGDLGARGRLLLQQVLQQAFPKGPPEVRIAFRDPAPEGTVFVGRNHPLVAGLARYVLERALRGEEFGRYTAIRTPEVERAVYVYLLRPRYLLRWGRASREVLGEEVLELAYTQGAFLPLGEARRFAELKPAGNVSPLEAREHLERALRLFQQAPEVRTFLEERAKKIQEDHRRVRQAAQISGRVEVVPVEGPDLLGVKVLLPMRG
ncbi:MAG: helicase-related protein, partial [Thermus sp.]